MMFLFFEMFQHHFCLYAW